jgi:hypothetical protein
MQPSGSNDRHYGSIPPHASFRLGTVYSTDRSGADYGTRDYVQYGDYTDDPQRRAPYGTPIYRAARYYEYSLTSLNVVGPFPRVPGVPSFRQDPYGYKWEHLDEWGSLGKFDWTKRPQLMPLDVEYPLHRAFIPLDNLVYKFDLRAHVVPAGGPDESLRVVEYDYLNRVAKAGRELSICLARIRDITAQSKVQLLSEPDEDWHYGPSWDRLLRIATEPQPPWKVVHLGQELRRRVLDGIGYVTMASRVFIYFYGLDAGLPHIRFRSSSRLAGLIVDQDDPRSRLIGEGLAKLGAPVWGMHILNRNAKVELYPRELTKLSPMWTEACDEILPLTIVHPLPPGLMERVQERFESKLQVMIADHTCHRVANHWVMTDQHAKHSGLPGHFFLWHEAHNKDLRGFGNENYHERVLKWLQMLPMIGAKGVLEPLREAMGESTIPSTPLPAGAPFDPIPPMLFANYDLVELFARRQKRPWARPADRLATRHDIPFAQRIAPSRVRMFEAPETSNEIPYSAPLVRERSPSPQIRRVRPKPTHSATFPSSSAPVEDDDLSPFEEEDPADLTMYLDPMMPSDVRSAAMRRAQNFEAGPVAEEEVNPWDDSCVESKQFPAELSPFAYFRPYEELEYELYVRYRGVVTAWRLEGSKLFLVFNSADRGQRIIDNQRRSSKSHPTEPSAKAAPLSTVADYYSPWSAKVLQKEKDRIQERFLERTTTWPPSAPHAIPADRGRDAILASLRSFVNPSLAGSPDSRAAGRSYHLMSRYAIPAVRLTDCLSSRQQLFYKVGISSADITRSSSESLYGLVIRHASYARPSNFRIPLPLAGPSRDLLIWITAHFEPDDPTSLLARGTFDTETFSWSSAREEYEIVLDNLDLTDLGFLMEE